MDNIFLKSPKLTDGIYSFMDSSHYNSFYEEAYLEINPDLHKSDVKSKTEEVIRALKHLPVDHLSKINSICDIGSGSSEVMQGAAVWLAETYKTRSKLLISIDISIAILKQIKPRDGFNIIKLQADAESLPLKNNAIDLVMLVDIIEHINHPSRAIDEALRVGKYCVIKTPIERSLYTLFRGGEKRLKQMEEKYGHIQHFSVKDIDSIITDKKVIYEAFIKIPNRSRLINLIQEILLGLKLNTLYGFIFGGFKICLITK